MSAVPACATDSLSTPDGRRGFTLVELLVALTLFGLISVALLGGLRFGTRVWEAGDTRADALAEIESVQGMLRRQIGRAVLPQPHGRGSEELGFFVGESDRMGFVTVVPAHFGVGGLYRVEIKLAEDDGERRLELTWRLFRPDDREDIDASIGDEDTVVGGRRTLLEGVESVTFAYYGGEERAREADWHETWEDTGGLPGLISLKVGFPDDSRRFWPELLVRPRLGGSDLRP